MRLDSTWAKSKRLLIVVTGLFLLFVIVAFTLKGVLKSQVPNLGSHFLYISTTKTGCEGSLCIEAVKGETRYRYATDLTLAGIKSFVREKGYKTSAPDFANIIEGVNEVSLYFTGDMFIDYREVPAKDSKDFANNKTLPPAFQTNFVEISDANAKKLR